MIKKKIMKDTRFYLLIFIVLLLTVFQVGNQNFLSAKNVFELLKSNSYMIIMSMGMLVVIISGGIDISICPIAGSAEFLMAWMVSSNPEISPVFAIGLPILLGLSMGLINGTLVHVLNVPPMIVTISTMNIYYGILQLLSKGNAIFHFPKWFQNLGSTYLFRFTSSDGMKSGLSLLTVISILIIALTYFLLNKTKQGRQIFALGGNQQAASRAGVNLLGNHLFIYGFCGLLSGIAGITHGLSAQYVAPQVIFGQEMLIIAAIALGGASLLGGYGTVSGTVMGIIVIRCISSGLTLNRVSTYWQDAILGFVILVSIILGSFKAIVNKRRSAA